MSLPPTCFSQQRVNVVSLSSCKECKHGLTDRQRTLLPLSVHPVSHTRALIHPSIASIDVLTYILYNIYYIRLFLHASTRNGFPCLARRRHYFLVFLFLYSVSVKPRPSPTSHITLNLPSLTHSLTHALSHPHTHALTHSLGHTHALTHSLIHSPLSLTHPPTHSPTHALTHSLIH